MTPEQFIATWKNNPLTERAGAQAHFDDLCDLLGVAKPRDPDTYCFERGARKAGGGDGWADVWKRGHFGWENKKPGRDLNAALKQLTDYALQLDNPPLLVVCDRERIVIHTAFTGYPDEPREIRIEQLVEPEARQTLKWVFTDPEKLRPEKSTADLPDSRLYAICRDDDATFGILSSRPHEVWSLANASMHGDGDEGGRPTYNAKSCFETFPFPPGLTPRDTAPVADQASPACMAGEIVAANIAAAARHLNELREAWLNPPEWVDWVITPEEEKAGFPKRPVAKPGHEDDLKKRTLANLYNARPAWLDLAHKQLDKSVAAAYGWSDYTPETPDAEILRRLLALNLKRAGSGS